VEQTWDYLHCHWSITDSDLCATHVHISFEPPKIYTDEEIRRIVLAAIHFETAFEVLVPASRRGNEHAKSNWLDGDKLGRESRSRPDSMAAISRAANLEQMIQLMQPLDDRNYCWNFNNLFELKRTIEFRKPPASTTADQALNWAELALSFVQASVVYGSLDRLRRITSNVRGLRWFLEQAHVPGMNEPARLQKIFEGKAHHAMREPRAVPKKADMTPREERVWQAENDQQISADRTRILMFARTVQAPYW